MRKIAILAPHYSEYSVRLAMAFQNIETISSMLLGRNESFSRELTPELSILAKSSIIMRTHPSESRIKDIYMSLSYIYDLMKFKPDIIIAPELGHWNYTPLLKIARIIAPIGLIVHDPSPHSGADSAHGARLFPRITAERDLASFFIVHGNYCNDRLRSVYGVGRRPVINIFHGPIVMEDDPKPPPLGEPKFLLFGRMQAYKGLETFLDAIDILHEKMIFPEAIIAGRGPEISRLRDRLNKKNISLIDKFIAPNEAIHLFQSASCLIAPYLDATQSGVIAAALANQRPVIASDVGALGEVIEDKFNGLLIKPGDPTLLANAIESYLENPALRDSLSEGARIYSERMTWDLVASDIFSGIKTAFPNI